MVIPATTLSNRLHEVLTKTIAIERGEAKVLLASFAMFLSVLCGYYIVRPVRDEMGVALGKDGLAQLFLAVFIVMLFAVPVFGWIVRTFERRRIVPLIYGFFIANLVAFWMLLVSSADAYASPALRLMLEVTGLLQWGPISDAYAHVAAFDPPMAAVFFVWVSVFNLFAVSLFWSLMSELYSSDQAKRLYGVIAAGGTTGAILGPSLTSLLAARIGPNNLLLVSAAFLGAALVSAVALRQLTIDQEAKSASSAGDKSGHILDGAVRVLTSPYMFGIALYILLANVIGTYFYLEQSRIVGEALAERAQRVEFFASRDLAVSLITLFLQLFVTGRVLQRFGLGPALAVLPLSAGLGLLALTVAPDLQVVAAVMALERAVAFSLSNPAVKVLWTAVSDGDKYKAQNFVDTVVYRGGDAASGWVFAGLAKAVGSSGAATALAAMPLIAVWVCVGQRLARQHKERRI